MRPDIDRYQFSVDVRDWLEDKGLSYRNASAHFPGLNTAMFSRARNGEVLSAASMLALCQAMGRDPARYLRFTNEPVRNQRVTANDFRETGRAI